MTDKYNCLHSFCMTAYNQRHLFLTAVQVDGFFKVLCFNFASFNPFRLTVLLFYFLLLHSVVLSTEPFVNVKCDE